MRVTTCTDAEGLAAAADLFDRYRRHHGMPSAGDGRVLDWLTTMVDAGMLTVHTASVDSPAGPVAVGLATVHAVPASLAMGQLWQLRDLYVLPEHRRLGAAGALVAAVREAARTAGATRLSLVTEPDNDAALTLYRRLGFTTVEGVVSLSLELSVISQDVGDGSASRHR